MTPKQRALHERALSICSQKEKIEFDLIRFLQEAEMENLHRFFHHRSLFQYAVKELGLSEPIALSFIAVARKAKEIPELKQAIRNGEICVSKANRIVSVLTNENATDVIHFASHHTWRETEREIAKRNPKAASPDRVKVLSEKVAQLLVSIEIGDLKDFERVLSLEAQRTGKSPSRGEGLRACFHAYLEKHDPVRKAERAQKKRSVRTEQISKRKVPSGPETLRTRLTAAEKHAVNRRDKGRCTFTDEKGIRCNQDRWTETHHIISVSACGSNEPSNLTTLCSFHHDLVHQLSLPIDSQITWLRSPSLPYGQAG